MLEYLDDLQERFFAWCDNAVQGYIDREGTMLKSWRPRKNPDGSYDLVFMLVDHKETAARFAVPVPDEFHELLEQEYFFNHPPDQDEED